MFDRAGLSKLGTQYYGSVEEAISSSIQADQVNKSTVSALSSSVSESNNNDDSIERSVSIITVDDDDKHVEITVTSSSDEPSSSTSASGGSTESLSTHKSCQLPV